MIDADLNRIVAEAARGHFSWIETAALVAEVRRLREKLTEIAATSGNARHIEIARAALIPPVDR